MGAFQPKMMMTNDVFGTFPFPKGVESNGSTQAGMEQGIISPPHRKVNRGKMLKFCCYFPLKGETDDECGCSPGAFYLMK